MPDVLADNPVLTLFLVVALGMSPARSGYTRRFAVDTILKVLLVQGDRRPRRPGPLVPWSVGRLSRFLEDGGRVLFGP
jgi:hypothetical protein